MKAITVKLATPALSELMKKRDQMGASTANIGEPSVEIPLNQIRVFRGEDGRHRAVFGMDNLIALVERTLTQ